MAGPTNQTDDKPLDPAVERIRRRLVRFIVINLGILFVALMAVVAALVYLRDDEEAPRQGASAPPSAEEMVRSSVALPAGARVLGHSVADGMLSIRAATPDGEAVFVYDMRSGGIVARYDIVTED